MPYPARVPFDGLRAVVLAYGGSGVHGPLLESLSEEGLPLEQVLVVHNPASLGEAPPPVPAGCEVLAAKRNLGYSSGMNLGIDRQLERGCSLLLLLTHDARLLPGSLAALVAAAEDQRFGILGPVLVHAGTETPFSFGGTSSPTGALGHRHRPLGAAAVEACDWVDGGTMLLRADLLRRLGGFDERFFLYCEDAEICLRARRADFEVGVVAGARAEQAPGGARRLSPWAYLLTRNGAAYAGDAKGLVGSAGAIVRALGLVWLNLARVCLRGLRLRGGRPAEPWALAVGTGLGIVDYLRGNWGPPPPLPGGDDIHNAG
jgi:GT2 family glycosyltransferase